MGAPAVPSIQSKKSMVAGVRLACPNQSTIPLVLALRRAAARDRPPTDSMTTSYRPGASAGSATTVAPSAASFAPRSWLADTAVTSAPDAMASSVT